MLKKTIAPPYYEVKKTPKIYKVALNQIGSNPPVVASILHIEIEGVSWEHDSDGVYKVTWPGFDETENVMTVQGTEENVIVSCYGTNSGTGYLTLKTYNVTTAALEDDLLIGALCEITAVHII